MTRCPTCRAPYRSGAACYRCGTRLEDVIAVERAAEDCRLAARRALERRDLVVAQGHIDRALFFHRSSAVLRVAALVALARRDFSAACLLWRESRLAKDRP